MMDPSTRLERDVAALIVAVEETKQQVMAAFDPLVEWLLDRIGRLISTRTPGPMGKAHPVHLPVPPGQSADRGAGGHCGSVLIERELLVSPATLSPRPASTTGPLCLATGPWHAMPDAQRCQRLRGHGGRHQAANTTGTIVVDWEDGWSTVDDAKTMTGDLKGTT